MKILISFVKYMYSPFKYQLNFDMIWINWQLSSWKYYISCTYSKLIYTIKDGCSFKNVIRYDFTMHLKGGSGTGAPGPSSPPVRKFLGVCIYRVLQLYSSNNVYNMSFVIYSHYKTWGIICVKGASKQMLYPKNLPCRDRIPPPPFKTLGSATASNATFVPQFTLENTYKGK